MIVVVRYEQDPETGWALTIDGDDTPPLLVKAMLEDAVELLESSEVNEDVDEQGATEDA